MKRIIITLTIAGAMLANSSFASGEKIAKAALQSFKTSFSEATNANWSNVQDLFKVNFTLANENVFAYYNAEGTLVATGRIITASQLPFSLQMSLKNKYGDYTVTDLLEMDKEQGTVYYATVETAKTKTFLESNTNAWSVYEKKRK